jgi:hypothetical protein
LKFFGEEKIASERYLKNVEFFNEETGACEAQEKSHRAEARVYGRSGCGA